MGILLNIEKEIKDKWIFTLDKLMKDGTFKEVPIPSIDLESPKDKDNGDYAINLGMKLSKVLGMNPRAIGEILKDNFPLKDSPIETIEIAGPGFINMKLKESYLNSVVNELLAEKENFGKSNFLEGRKINIEFVSANPTGVLHMGNARGAAIGDTLGNILNSIGANVTKEYYINDAGKQIENFGLSLNARYLEKKGEDFPFPEDGYHGLDIMETVEGYILQEDRDLRELSVEERIDILTKYSLEEKINNIKETLETFNLKFDVWFRESSLYKNNLIDSSIEKLKESKATIEKDGALWIKGDVLKSDKDEVLIRNNKIPTYFAGDIAYHQDKFRRGFVELINVWGADHHGHVERMKRALDAVGENGDALEVILMQLVRLFKDGDILRMSKRTGTYITLKELLEEVGLDAARYFFLMRNPDTHLDFDMDLAKSKSNDNPIFYIQYAYARICSILRKIDNYENYCSPIDDVTNMHFERKEEIELIQVISKYEKILIESGIRREPYKIAKYALDLSSGFHNFYSNLRVINEDGSVMEDRLKLILGTKYLLKSVLDIMGVSAPERM